MGKLPSSYEVSCFQVYQRIRPKFAYKSLKLTWELAPIQFTKTADMRILGSMNEIFHNYQFIAETHEGEFPISLSDVEVELSNMPSGRFQKKFPSYVALELLT